MTLDQKNSNIPWYISVNPSIKILEKKNVTNTELANDTFG